MLAFALLGAEWVMWLLVVMSAVTVAIAIERAVYLWQDRTDRESLKQALDGFAGGGQANDLEARLGALDGYQARVLASGLHMAPNGPEAAELAIASIVNAEKIRMERGLSFLATVGSNAPFIGLLGTVLGIMKAFRDLASDSEDATQAVMAGISEALVATAVGLMVAIPAVILYNVFIRAVRNRQRQTESLAQNMLAHLGALEGARGK